MADDLDAANLEVLEYLFDELAKLGVEEFCIAAGARNAPIIAGLYHERSCARKRYHFFDERSAGFFALGRMLDTQKPVAVVTTSGTAVAELLPAAIEAYYQALPLVIVSADRPSSYRGSGAPQAIEQKQLFEPYLGIRRDVEFRSGSLHVERKDFRRTGHFPFHFNVCLEERVLPTLAYEMANDGHESDCDEPTRSAQAVEAWNQLIQQAPEARWAVLVGGIPPHLAPAVSQFVEAFAAPFLAEDTANLSANLLASPQRLQGGESALSEWAPTHILRLGAVPAWRYWRDLENDHSVQVFNFATGGFSGLARQDRVQTHSLPPFEVWQKLQVPASKQPRSCEGKSWEDSIRALVEQFPQAEPALLLKLAWSMPKDSKLFLGNSLTIRYWNKLCVGIGATRCTFANRGANGIDGLISTWLALGAEADHSTIILGDLSALYDLSAPWILPQLRTTASRHLVIVNNGGGKIFSGLPWLKNVPAATQIAFENTHQLRFDAWAAMWKVPYQKVNSVEQLPVPPVTGLQVTELLPETTETVAFWKAFESLNP